MHEVENEADVELDRLRENALNDALNDCNTRVRSSRFECWLL